MITLGRLKEMIASIEKHEKVKDESVLFMTKNETILVCENNIEYKPLVELDIIQNKITLEGLPK